MQEHWFTPGDDLGDFRYSVANFIRLLIRARLSVQPSFFSQQELERWSVVAGGTGLPAWQLLHLAAKEYGRLNRDFLYPCGSGGAPLSDEGTPEGRLIQNVSFLVPREGGGPDHNARLIKAGDGVKAGDKVEWDQLVEWALLDSIRSDLDLLPFRGQEGSVQEPVQLEPAAGLGNSLQRVGRTWVLKFEEQEVPVGVQLGFLYISWIVLSPAKPFKYSELWDARVAWASSPTVISNKDAANSVETQGSGLSEGISTSNQELVDEDAVLDVKRRMAAALDEIEKAKWKGDHGRVATLEAEHSKLQKYLNESHSPSGRRKSTGGRTRRPRQAVEKAIRRAIDSLYDVHPAGWLHFENSIKLMPDTCWYQPERAVKWEHS